MNLFGSFENASLYIKLEDLRVLIDCCLDEG